MRSPTYALIWEQWRQVWWTLPLGILGTVFVSLSLKYFDGNTAWRKDVWMVGSTGTVFAFLLLAGGLLLFAHSSPTDVRTGIPQRHRTLPVAPITLALSQYLFRIAFISAFSVLLMGVVSATDRNYLQYIVPSAAVAACAMSLATAMMWTIGTRRVGVAAVVAVVIALVCNALYAFVEHKSPSIAPIVPILVFVVSSVVAIGSSAHRTGRNNSHGQHRRKIAQRDAVNRSGFSKRGAQYWFDTARRARVVWTLTAIIALPIVMIFAVRMWNDYEQYLLYVRLYGTPSLWHQVPENFLEWGQMLIWFPPVVAFASGICFVLLDVRDSSLHSANFLFTRPISTADIVRARRTFALRTATLLCAPTFLLSISFALVGYLLVPGGFSNLQDFYLSREYLLALILSWIASVLLFWATRAALASGVWFAFALAWEHDLGGLEIGLGAIPAVIAIVAILLGVKVHRLRLWDASFVPVAILCGVLFWLGLIWLESGSRARHDDEILFVSSCIAALIPYALFSQSLWIDFLRHGGLSRLGKRYAEGA